MKNLLSVLFILSMLTGCAAGGFDSIQKTQQLQPGMTYQQTVNLLGEPKTTEARGESLVATFWLHQSWRGNVPYDLTFDTKTRTLNSWQENQEKFAAAQSYLAGVAASVTEFTQKAASGNGSTKQAPAEPNDPKLQKEMAGTWYGYSGSTESQMALCPDGSYNSLNESSYSGSSSNQYGSQTMAWGNANQSGGQGQWTVSGTLEKGIVHITYNDGSSKNLNFTRYDAACMKFDGSILCIKSHSCN